MAHLVSTEELAGLIGTPGLVIFDASFYLPTEGHDAAALYRQAHIPGALFFDIDAISDHATDLPHMLPSPGAFAAAVGALGVSNASKIVVYDQKGLFSAARVWWMFQVFGHGKVKILDGGLPKWQIEGRAVSNEAPAPVQTQRFIPTYHARLVRGAGDMLDNLIQADELVLDARAASRYAGEAPEPRAGVRAGHIPGAISLPFGELLNPDGTMKAPAALRARFAAAGVEDQMKVVTSCGSGVTACVLTLGMAQAGLPMGAVYDGSWSEWGAREDLEIATGHG
ncbi:MAG: 3-mercaptopyruvate sulfurtransferase [Rhodospirillales bacterium 20-60-12]|nr:MAG: 3-mercaptopyruvate sulfurtransferase [Rhodospirillales bacterium 20-60-12]HQT68463.1 3-mercaptopyruvate sulfurtransferase [Acetobacteraceae bacterium]HQU01887.1 3-mercaptopyruvate sulfurtransferase [Acetobacteraceae bacterium]